MDGLRIVSGIVVVVFPSNIFIDSVYASGKLRYGSVDVLMVSVTVMFLVLCLGSVKFD
jgi:hypothetical protein